MRSKVGLQNWSKLITGLFLFIFALHFLLDQFLQESFSVALEATQSSALIALLAISALTADVILPIPSSVISVSSVLALGSVGGYFAIWLGLCLGCLLGYWLGKTSRTWFIGRLFKEQDIEQAQQFAQRWGLHSLVLLRAVPVLAEASVIVAGMSKLPLRNFILVTAMANAGIALVYALIAAYAQLEASFILAFTASLVLPLGALGVTRFATKRKHKSLVQTLRPAFEMQFSFPLHFTKGVFAKNNSCLANTLRNEARSVKALFFVDSGLVRARPGLALEIEEYCKHHQIDHFQRMHIVPGGDEAKTQTQIESMYKKMLDVALDRQSYVIAIGGGGVLDAVGYAAATFHRGIRLLRMPTTVLAQNDAGVGVKNGINAMGIKNLYGSFAVPTAIINDAEFLHTLSRRDYRSGFAEAIKVGLIRDGEFFHWICQAAEKLNMRDEAAAHHLIKRCAELHLQQICKGGDPFELGSARPLDYGHWSAHKLESLTEHELAHGEAVAIGMCLDSLYAVERDMLLLKDAELIIDLIKNLGFDIWHDALEWENDSGESVLLKGLEEFRQHLGGELCITMLRGIGETVELNHIDSDALLRARDRLKHYENSRPAGQSPQLLQ